MTYKTLVLVDTTESGIGIDCLDNILELPISPTMGMKVFLGTTPQNHFVWAIVTEVCIAPTDKYICGNRDVHIVVRVELIHDEYKALSETPGWRGEDWNRRDTESDTTPEENYITLVGSF